MKLVQIKGSNGSGKTTIVKQMLELDPDAYYLEYDGMIIATVMPTVRWIAVGKYDLESKMGGCDRLSSVDKVKDAIDRSLDWACELSDMEPMYGIVYEGMMISTIKTTFYDYAVLMASRYDVDPLFVILSASPKGCMHRIQDRGTARKDLNHDNVANKCLMVRRHALTYDPELVRWMDVERIPEAYMLQAFAALVGDHDLVARLVIGADWGE